MPRANVHKLPTQPKVSQPAEWLKPAATALGVLLLLAGLEMLRQGITSAAPENDADFKAYGLNYAWSLYFGGFKAHRDFIIGATLIGSAVALVTVSWGLFDSKAKPSVKPSVFYGVAGAFAVFMTLFILHYGMHQIGGYDQSNLVDSSWRLLKRQTAYVDFPFTLPVMYTLGGKFAFQWFGVYWRAFVEMMALFAVPTFAWMLFLLAQLFGRNWTTLLWTVAIQIFAPMMAAYWTYNPITAISAVIFTLSATYWLHRPDEKIPLVSYGAALWLMATMKPNVAGILIPGVSFILFISPKHRWNLVWASLIAFAFFLLFLWVNNMSFFGTIAGYLSVAKRGASLVPFLIDLDPLEKCMGVLVLVTILLPTSLALSQGRETKPPVIAWIPAIIMLAGFCVFAATKQNKPVGEATIFIPVAVALVLGRKSLRYIGPWIPTFVLLGGLYGFITNSEQKLVDMPPVLCAAILLAAEMRSPAFSAEGPVFAMPLWWNRYLALACVVLGVTGLAQGVARDRIQSIGPVQFFEWDDSHHTIPEGFFQGVHCGDVLNGVVEEVTVVIQRQPSATVWFGPRMQWGYAAYDKPSPHHEPVIWDPQTMFNDAQRAIYFNNFLQNRRELLILFKNDLTHYEQDEVQQIAQRYSVDQSYPLLTVLRLKQ